MASLRSSRYTIGAGLLAGEAEMAYRKSFVVRWSECDANGHLRNTAYSEYAIETRMGFLAENGFPYGRFKEAALGPVIQREEIDYLRELHLGDTVELDFKALGTSPEGGRFKLAHDFYGSGGERVARIVIRGGWLDLRTRKLRAPPDDLLRVVNLLERVEPWEELPAIGRREA
ncbi:MAG TPA: acyl-CoA thioesterase [Anaeromyxobacter sp.]|nr:acyl-CoA thioesterase [Anaeromyxobacter sp.]